jgi:hypothetical protein
VRLQEKAHSFDDITLLALQDAGFDAGVDVAAACVPARRRPRIAAVRAFEAPPVDNGSFRVSVMLCAPDVKRLDQRTSVRACAR